MKGCELRFAILRSFISGQRERNCGETRRTIIWSNRREREYGRSEAESRITERERERQCRVTKRQSEKENIEEQRQRELGVTGRERERERGVGDM